MDSLGEFRALRFPCNNENSVITIPVICTNISVVISSIMIVIGIVIYVRYSHRAIVRCIAVICFLLV